MRGHKEKYKQLTGGTVSVFVCVGVYVCACGRVNHLIKKMILVVME